MWASESHSHLVLEAIWKRKRKKMSKDKGFLLGKRLYTLETRKEGKNDGGPAWWSFHSPSFRCTSRTVWGYKEHLVSFNPGPSRARKRSFHFRRATAIAAAIRARASDVTSIAIRTTAEKKKQVVIVLCHEPAQSFECLWLGRPLFRDPIVGRPHPSPTRPSTPSSQQQHC